MPPVELPDRVVDAYPVSAMQLGLIYECLVSADPTLYHDLTSVRLRGPLDTAALRRALDLVSTRHEALRTSFDMVNFAEPTQLVHRHAPIPVVVEQAAEGTEPQTALRQWWTAQWRRPFERDRPPLVRCHVLVHPDQTFHLSLSVHHAVLDGWSFAVLVAELIRAYDQELGGADAALPALPATRFRDFVALERQAVYSEQTRRFWRRIGDLRRAPLPRRSTDGPTSPGVDPDVHRTLPAPLAAAVRRVAADLAVPPKSVYLTAHLWALGALCGAPHAVSGVVTNGRQEAEGADRVLGLFLNVLPLGVELAGGSWTDLIREVFASERECLPYRRYPLAQITEDIGETPCEAVFNYTDLYAFDAIGELTRLDVVDWWFCDRTSFPLVLEVNHQPSTGAAELSIRLDHGELAPEVAGRMAELFTGALTLISDDVKAPYPPPG